MRILASLASWCLVLRSLALAATVAGCARAGRPPPGGAPPAGGFEPAGPIRHVVVVTVDGLMPDSYLHPDAHGLRVPTLRRMVREGASSDGALSVFPSVTYPAHTSIATGVLPARHGIFTNRAFDPLDTNQEGWRWYAEDIRATTIWQLAEGAHYRAALVHWPVTVGAKVTFLVPEYWRAKNDEDRKLLRSLSTPGLLEGVAAETPGFWSAFTPGEMKDPPVVDVAVYLLRSRSPPHLTLLHIADVDGVQHRHGVWSAPAIAAIEDADRQLARLLEAIALAGIGGDTILVVASDHGFANIARLVRPGVLLRQGGLVTLEGAEHVVSWRAATNSAGGGAYVYLAHPGDAALAETVRGLLRGQMARPGGGGIARLLEAEEIRAIGGDPNAFLALEAAAGYAFGPGYTGDVEVAAQYAANHGYDPARPEMRASLLVLGPGVRAGPLRGARLIDIAPTIAAWLGLAMPPVDGRPLFPP